MILEECIFNSLLVIRSYSFIGDYACFKVFFLLKERDLTIGIDYLVHLLISLQHALGGLVIQRIP